MTKRKAPRAAPPPVTRKDFENLSFADQIKFAAPPTPNNQPPSTRAVLRLVEPANVFDCNICGDPLKFSARERREQVIANVYTPMGEWALIKTFHPECYQDLKEPFGPAEAGKNLEEIRARRASTTQVTDTL
jgi:hypothetical protein